MAPQRCKVPISIFAVNRIEVIDYIDCFTMISISKVGDLNHISPNALIFLTQSDFFDLPLCGNEQMVIITPKNVQFVKASEKESSCSFNMVKLMVKERWCLIGMLDAGMWIMIILIQIGQIRYVNFMKCNNNHMFTFIHFEIKRIGLQKKKNQYMKW